MASCGVELLGPELVSGSGSSFSYLPPRGTCLCAFNQCLLLWFSRSVVSDSLRPHGLQLSRLPCPSPSPGVCPNSCPLNRSCHPTISSSVILFPSCLQPFSISRSFPVNQQFVSGGQSNGASVSLLKSKGPGELSSEMTRKGGTPGWGAGLALKGQEGLGKQAESLQAAIKKEQTEGPQRRVLDKRL